MAQPEFSPDDFEGFVASLPGSRMVDHGVIGRLLAPLMNPGEQWITNIERAKEKDSLDRYAVDPRYSTVRSIDKAFDRDGNERTDAVSIVGVPATHDPSSK